MEGGSEGGSEGGREDEREGVREARRVEGRDKRKETKWNDFVMLESREAGI